MKHVLGIDVGTTAIKAVSLGADGTLGRVASTRYSLHAGSEGRFEQDPAELLGALTEAVKQASAGRDIVGVGLSTQAAALLLLDKNAQPIRPIISWMDHRAKAQSQALSERLGTEYFRQRTGLDTAGIATPVLLWLREHELERLKSAAAISFVEDWLARWLTGSGASDPSNASITGLLNLDTLTWDADLIVETGLGTELFPPMRRAGEVAGQLLPDPANRLGLPPDIPIAVAAHDQHSAAIGAGLVDGGMAMLSTGTAWVIFAIAKTVDRDNLRGLFLSPYAGGNFWGALGALPAGNGYFDRIMDALGVEDYETAEREAREVGPGAANLLFLPCIGGRREAAWIGFTLEHACGNMLRSVMEGLAMETAFMLQDVERVTGDIREMAMLGGSAKNRLWVEIVASVFDRPVTVPGTPDAAAVGAAVLGGVAAGWSANAREGRAQVKLPAERVEIARGPYREIVKRYADARAKFMKNLEG